ncbi:Na+/H+ antiporter NhaC family protein [Candidatus Thiothrix anitrata]|uniref:Sodium:proton antiporter n=1 Tax=Candidatus Thiothrix anitrata TaxID=2823902 RepID=A0ABX7X5W3_9GAMM|nr:Na+/H+ antiporter NhaC family protein [Candidatus Thiothrix anitrata]QTR50218.1 sodium:proton antiporter [Candidatus Thiothrix anitrata]
MDYGVLSILPPLLAITLALVTRDVLISLTAGILAGFLILNNYQPLDAVLAMLDSIVGLFAEGWVVKTLLFSLLVGSVIRLMMDSGGVAGLVYFLTQKSRTVRSARGSMLLAYFIGLIIFIESSITSLVAGTVARPLCDKYGVSRQKLAYICDSTSAPVCSLIPLNGWGALLLGLLATQITAGVLSGSAVEILFKSIVYNFYAWLALILVLVVILRDWDLGSMRRFEESTTSVSIPVPAEGLHVSRMLLPLVVLIGMVPVSLYFTGQESLLSEGKALENQIFLDAIFAGSGSTSVFYAVLATLLVAFVQYVILGSMSRQDYFRSAFAGAGELLPIVTILVLAFVIGNLVKELDAGNYLASLAQGWLSAGWIPVLIFLLSAGIAFATGTSWGTFSIMMPIGVSLAVATGADVYLVVGAVISGGVCGDHASPISDTTIISSLAAGCDVADHATSQLPYALLAGAGAAVLFAVFGFALL